MLEKSYMLKYELLPKPKRKRHWFIHFFKHQIPLQFMLLPTISPSPSLENYIVVYYTLTFCSLIVNQSKRIASDLKFQLNIINITPTTIDYLHHHLPPTTTPLASSSASSSNIVIIMIHHHILLYHPSTLSEPSKIINTTHHPLS